MRIPAQPSFDFDGPLGLLVNQGFQVLHKCRVSVVDAVLRRRYDHLISGDITRGVAITAKSFVQIMRELLSDQEPAPYVIKEWSHKLYLAYHKHIMHSGWIVTYHPAYGSAENVWAEVAHQYLMCYLDSVELQLYTYGGTDSG